MVLQQLKPLYIAHKPMKTTPNCVEKGFYEREQDERKLLLLMCKNAAKSRVGEKDGEHYDLKKIVYGILLIAAALTILLLTFQDAAGTVKLSEGLRLWLERFGLKSDFHSIRSNAHLVLYFLFGIVLCLYGRECGWRWWVVLAVGCGIGLIDESIKVLLPTREFDFVDLVKDWIGIGLAAFVVLILKRSEAR